MSRHIRINKFRNDFIRENVRVAHLEEKITKVRLQRFEHVQRKSLETLVRKVD